MSGLRRALICALLLVSPAGNRAAASLPAARDEPGLQVVAVEDRLILEWQAPEVALSLRPDGSVRVEMPGFSQVSQPGAPRLPFAAALVALPAGARPSLEIGRVQAVEAALPGPLALAGAPLGVRRAPDGLVYGGEFAPAPAAPFHPAPLELQMLGALRGIRLARLVFYPALPAAGGLRLVQRVEATLRFNAPARPLPLAEGASDSLLGLLEAQVVNPQHLQRAAPSTYTPTAPRNSPVGAPLAAVEVSQTGVVALSHDALASAGVPPGQVNPNGLHLSRAGVELPFEWEGDSDDLFEAGERLLFFAEPRFSRWTNADVYLLSLAETPGAAVESRPAAPAGLPPGARRIFALAEDNRIYTPDCYCAPIPPGRDGDRWAWSDLQLPAKPTGDFEIRLTSVDRSRTARLEVWLIGYTQAEVSPDHLVAVSLNGASLGVVEWEGKQAVHAQFEVPALVLNEGVNTLTLTLVEIPGAGVQGAWLDAFAIAYDGGEAPAGQSLLFSGEETPHAYTLKLDSTAGLRAYDVSDAERPLRLEGAAAGPENAISFGDPAEGGLHRYFVSAEQGLIQPDRVRPISPLLVAGGATGVDYLAIAPAAFISSLEGLLALQRERGLRVAVEELQAIYDSYGDGRPDPAAIRAYLAEAYASWSPAPLYVLLVGDGTSDPKRYLPTSAETFLPPFLAEVDPWAGETASDNRYVTLEGEDNLPEMLVGRLPVRSPEETRALAEKIAAYGASPAPGSWNGRGAFVADDPDGGGDFPALSEALLAALEPAPFVPHRLYYTPPQAAQQVRDRLLERWNAGAGLLAFTGHASIHQWAVEQFFHIDDVGGLSNGGRLPVLLELTCFTASFQVPGFATLDEALLLHPRGGVVAAWGATGLGIATGHQALAQGFLDALFESQVDLGSAALAGKLNLLLRSPAHSDLIDTFTLLGDPATRYRSAPGTDSIYMPLIQQR